MCFRLKSFDEKASFSDELALALALATGLLVRVTPAASWSESAYVVDAGQSDLGAMTRTVLGGFAPGEFSKIADDALLVAPVAAGARYAEEPVHYADLVVHRRSGLRALADLEGGTIAYARPELASSRAAIASRLVELGRPGGFFARAITAGSTVAALDLVANGGVDAASVDSLALETELRRRPELAREVQVIDAFGPLPNHPLGIARKVEAGARRSIFTALTTLHARADGAALLARAGLARFIARKPSDYDDLRQLQTRAADVRLAVDAA